MSWIGFILAGAIIVKGGLDARRIVDICRQIGSSCQSGVFSLFTFISSPLGFLVLIGTISFTVILVRIFTTILSAKRSITSFTSSSVPEELTYFINNLDGETIVKVAEDERPIAFTAGILRPVICISTGLLKLLAPNEMINVIAHEHAHIKRHDNLLIFLTMIARDFLFFVPLGHYLFGLFIREKELAADDVAADLTGDRMGLANAIISVSRNSLKNFDPSPAYATFFPLRETVEMRVKHLLGYQYVDPRKEITRFVLAVATSLVVGFLIYGTAQALPNRNNDILHGCKGGPPCTSQSHSCCKSLSPKNSRR